MFCYRRTAQYHETDQMGIIHHANYIKWMEEARVAFMDEVFGFGYVEMEAAQVFSPVIGVELAYRRPVWFADRVEIEVEIASYTGMRLVLNYRMRNVTKGTLCTTATSTHCFLRDNRVVSLKTELPVLDEKIRACMKDAERAD